MKLPSFKTGIAHQEKTAKWIIGRLSNRYFFHNDDQSGVLLADAVGMGKTWEALAGTALILNKMEFIRTRTKGNILIICPPNLITKWEDELSAGSPFRERLDQWIRIRGTQAAKMIGETLACVVPVRRSRHVQTRKKYGKFHPESGTYIVSHSLLCRSGRGLSYLRKHKWDVIIVDEAHHVSARKALSAIKSDCGHKLLLTATPFQLEPKEWNHLTRRLVKIKGSNILGCAAVKTYLEKVAAHFQDSGTKEPTCKEIVAAEQVLIKVAARTTPKKSSRAYSVILPNGKQKDICGRLDELDDDAVKQMLIDLENEFRVSIKISNFDSAYLRFRYDVADRDQPTFVANDIRRFLAIGKKPEAMSPRLVALQEWAKRRWVDDIEFALKDGLPRKTIVFTSWVGDIAAELKNRLSSAFLDSLKIVKRRHIKDWEKWHTAGVDKIRNLANKIRVPQEMRNYKLEKRVQQINEIFERLAEDELCAVLAGSTKSYLGNLKKQIKKQLEAIGKTWVEYSIIKDKSTLEGRGAKRRLNDKIGGLQRWSNLHGIENVERYTGDENRNTRDSVAAAFCNIARPWVIVASNVGAEGIDLHTYTRRIVHYDLEWNPARMEQREGRGDRVGRIIKEPLDIAYCIVPRTYDERMFHQLVARDRWHGVLLGKAAAKLAKDDGAEQVRIESAKFIRKVRLDLSPK